MKRVSFVITLYNKTPYLPYLLGGLAAQKGDFEAEYVFVDDGSTDDTVQALKEQTQGWDNVIIIEQKNAGPAVAINNGFKRASGDYIKPIDGDDMLLPHATQSLIEALEAHDADFSYAPYIQQSAYIVGQDPQEALQIAHNENAAHSFEDNFFHISLKSAQTNPTCWLAKREIVERSGGSDEAIFIQDYSLELRLALICKAARLDDVIMAIPQEAEGRLSGNDAQILHDVNLALMRFVREHEATLSRDVIQHSIRRALGRAWKWKKRHGTIDLSGVKLAIRYLTSSFIKAKPSEELEKITCAPFTHNAQLRLKSA